MTQTFAADVDAWVQRTQARQEAVFRESLQRLVEDMQKPVGDGGNMPVDTGFLRASIQASKSGPPPTRGGRPRKGATYNYTPDDINLVIASATLGETVWVTYGANYARAVEYGANGREARGFVRSATQKWQQFVTEVSREARGRAGGS